MADAAFATSAGISYEEFLDAYDTTHAEWVDGQVVPMTPVATRHQDVTDWLTVLLRLLVERNELGKVLSAPVQMRLPRSGREPDVMFIAREKLERVRELYVEGPADLVIEVVSPESQTRNRRDKLREYEAAGVREYWIIDPVGQEAEFCDLGKDGRYERVPLREGVFHSVVVPGLWLRVEWLWQQPLPSLWTILREWKLV